MRFASISLYRGRRFGRPRGRDGVAWFILGDCGSLDPSSNLGPGPPGSRRRERRPHPLIRAIPIDRVHLGRRRSPVPPEGGAMIKQPRKEYAPLDLEKQVTEFWRRTKAYEKTKKFRENGKDFYFVDGPPYTTGAIHLGNALNKVIKAVVLRWRRMKGYNLRDQAGYDMHGLPIEVQVEKTLGITNKQEIESLGIEKFVATCRQFSLDLLAKMTEQYRQLGVWMDWDNPYMTIKNNFIEADWWTMKKAHEKGLLVRSARSLQWCSRCETALAEAEVEYTDETDPAIYVKFPLKDRENESLLIWTTTPWTIPANLAVAVHPEFTYGKVEIPGGERVWILEET